MSPPRGRRASASKLRDPFGVNRDDRDKDKRRNKIRCTPYFVHCRKWVNSLPDIFLGKGWRSPFTGSVEFHVEEDEFETSKQAKDVMMLRKHELLNNIDNATSQKERK